MPRELASLGGAAAEAKEAAGPKEAPAPPDSDVSDDSDSDDDDDEPASAAAAEARRAALARRAAREEKRKRHRAKEAAEAALLQALRARDAEALAAAVSEAEASGHAGETADGRPWASEALKAARKVEVELSVAEVTRGIAAKYTKRQASALHRHYGQPLAARQLDHPPARRSSSGRRPHAVGAWPRRRCARSRSAATGRAHTPPPARPQRRDSFQRCDLARPSAPLTQPTLPDSPPLCARAPSVGAHLLLLRLGPAPPLGPRAARRVAAG